MQNNWRTFMDIADDIETKILKMSCLVNKELKLAVDTLISQQNKNTGQVSKLDKKVDDYDSGIYSDIINLILIQPPLSSELEALTRMNRISREYERIGDHAVNIADLSDKTNIHPKSSIYQELRTMCEVTTSMLEDSMEVIQQKNLSLAAQMKQQDDVVDCSFHQLHQLIVNEMKQTPDEAESLANLLLISRHLERSADHIVNVVKQVTKMVHTQ